MFLDSYITNQKSWVMYVMPIIRQLACRCLTSVEVSQVFFKTRSSKIDVFFITLVVQCPMSKYVKRY